MGEVLWRMMQLKSLGEYEMKIEDFADISECLRGGIFVLLYRGEVVYIGKASRAMLGTISNLRSKNLPSWMPRITFDQVFFARSTPIKSKASTPACSPSTVRATTETSSQPYPEPSSDGYENPA